MKNKKQTILIILISVLIILGITAVVLTTTINKTKANTGTGEEDINAQQTISFNDENLYNAIKEQLHSKNIEYTANDTNKTLTMTQENINKVQELPLQENDISDLTGLEKFIKLTKLELADNNIENITILSDLKELESLGLMKNKITDIDSLSNLEKITWLNISYNGIEDIEVLSNLKKLKELHMEKNPISDISALEKLPLEWLSADNCKIEDISPLNTNLSLETTSFFNQKISKTITSGREIALPQILIDAKNPESKAYVGSGKDYQLTNCTISSDGKKVIVNNGATTATVTIGGTLGAHGTVLQIDVASDTTKPILTVTYNPPQTQETTESVVVTIKSNEDIDTTKIPESWTVVDSRTIQRTYLENTQDEITIYDLAGNSNKITIEVTNIIKQCNHTGGYTTKWNETEHWKECNDCQEEIPNTRENHNITNYISNGDETHSGTCTKCQYKLTEACTYDGNTCTKCGATKPNTGCVHNYITQYNETEHWEYCTKCKTELEGSRKKHTFGTPTSNGNGTHTKKCTGCPYSKIENCTYVNGKCSECGANKPDTECTHTYKQRYNGVQHYEECTKCGAEKPGSRQNHTYGVATSNENGTHSKKCTGCPYIRIEYCNYINGKCSECGANKPDTECTHNYEIKYNEIEHWEECTKCGAEKSGSRQNHTYGTATGNGNGTHSRKCIVCPHIKTEKCNCSIGGLCSICGDKEYIEDCEHSYEIKYNETEHWEECTKCGAEKPESRVIHTYGVATSNENGTHSKKCTGCPYIRTEYCSYVNGKCSECGATKPDNENPGDGQDNTNNGQNNGNTNNGNSNNGNSNNGNSGGKPLPQTGTSSIVIIGIIAFTVLGTLTFIRIKKYKLN